MCFPSSSFRHSLLTAFDWTLVIVLGVIIKGNYSNYTALIKRGREKGGN